MRRAVPRAVWLPTTPKAVMRNTLHIECSNTTTAFAVRSAVVMYELMLGPPGRLFEAASRDSRVQISRTGTPSMWRRSVLGPAGLGLGTHWLGPTARHPPQQFNDRD